MTEQDPNNQIQYQADSEAAVLVEQVSAVVEQFDEIIRLLDPKRGQQVEEEPMILMLPTEEYGEEEGFPGVALVLASPTEVLGADGEVDQEFLGKLIKKAGKALRKVNWKKVGKIAGAAIKGGLKGASGGISGIIKGAAVGGIGAIVKGGSSGSSRPSQPGRRPVVVQPGMVTPGVTQLGQAGAPVINQYITHNCGPDGSAKVGSREDIEPEWFETRPVHTAASEGDCGCGPHESNAEHETFTDDIVDQVYPSVSVEAGHSGEVSDQNAVLEFLEGIRQVRDLLNESLPMYQGFEWEQELSHE